MSHLTPEDQSLLERARLGDAASSDDHARVKRKLILQLGVGLGVGASAGSATGAGVGTGTGFAAGGAVAGTKAAILGKVIAGVVVACALGGGVAAVHHWRDVPPAAPGVQAFVSSASPPSLPASTSPIPIVAPPPSMTVVAPEPTVHVLPRPASARRDDAPRSTLSASPIVREWSDPPRPSVTATTPPPTPPGPATLQAEAELLRSADAARKSGDAPGAMALIEQHRTRYPNGILVEEREAERVVILCASGRSDEARAAAARFLGAHPRSPMAARVRASCGGD